MAKVMVTRDFILRIVKSESKAKTLAVGNWIQGASFNTHEVDVKGATIKWLVVSPPLDKQCVGCLVGKTFCKLAEPGQKRIDIFRASESAAEIDYASVPADRAEGRVARQIERGYYTRAMSTLFESTFRYDTVRRFCSRIRRLFPTEFPLDIDGLKLKTKLPKGVRLLTEEEKVKYNGK